MAALNFTGDGQQKTFEDLPCSSYIITGLLGYFTFLSVVNSFLATTDLCVGLIAEPLDEVAL